MNGVIENVRTLVNPVIAINAELLLMQVLVSDDLPTNRNNVVAVAWIVEENAGGDYQYDNHRYYFIQH